jgi:hypothetical protein
MMEVLIFDFKKMTDLNDAHIDALQREYDAWRDILDAPGTLLDDKYYEIDERMKQLERNIKILKSFNFELNDKQRDLRKKWLINREACSNAFLFTLGTGSLFCGGLILTRFKRKVWPLPCIASFVFVFPFLCYVECKRELIKGARCNAALGAVIAARWRNEMPSNKILDNCE